MARRTKSICGALWRVCVHLLACALSVLVACGSDDGASSGGEVQPVAWSVAVDPVGDALLVTPSIALDGGSVYGVIATRRISDGAGRRLLPSTDFAALIATDVGQGGPTALYSADVEAAGNPYPDARLVRGGGTIHVPDRYVLRGLPSAPELETARAILRDGARQLETLRGFSTTAPIRIALSAAVDLATVDASSLFVVERADGDTDLGGLLDLAAALGIERGDVALAFSFPTQPIEDDLVAVQTLLRDRGGEGGAVQLVDPDPDDDLPIGVFTASDAEFADFFRAAPHVSAVVAGLVASPDFRDADGIWIPARVAGDEPAPDVALDFLLTLPDAVDAPYPVVMLQHGFGGDNHIVLELGEELAARGLATIGINAVAHGRRGSPLELLGATVFVARDIFRQSIADQMAVLRAIEAGIDVDGDGGADLDPQRMSYLGISLGGLLGATLVAVEDILPVAVLNVAGGRVAFLGQSEGLRDLVGGELARIAELDPASPTFAIYLQRILESGQHAMDSVDGLNFARRWFLDPFAGSPRHRVLLQEGIGDMLVDNESTEALATAGGLLANVAMSDPDGVSGLWRFDPPGGHGILARPDVREQALQFLLSDGTQIVDPAAGAPPLGGGSF